MEITEVQIKTQTQKEGPVVAFCSIVFDGCFRIRDLRIIKKDTRQRNQTFQVETEKYFVAMPSRKNVRQCHRCGGKNNHNVRFCNHCGTSLAYSGSTAEQQNDEQGGFTDLAHPITSEFREKMEYVIVSAFLKEQAKAG